MGIPPTIIIEKMKDPNHEYDYVVYCGWKGKNRYYVVDAWLKYFEHNYGTQGLNFGEPWFQSTYTNKLYFKEKNYAFFMMKFGYMLNKRPREL